MKNLPEILEKHAAWLRGEEGGERADLSGADLFRAYLSRAYLSRADLSGADLYRADLSVADLSGAYLTRAYLRGANLSMADLRGANLSVADLRGADLTVANLTGANLTRANLTRANLTRANLTRADLSWADLSVADLSGANLSGAVGLPNIDPFDINSAVYEACSAPGALDMKAWHTCETTHCRAGWAVILHPQGRELEDRFGTNAAAALIYNACAGFVPDFYASNEDAIRDIAEKAGK